MAVLEPEGATVRKVISFITYTEENYMNLKFYHFVLVAAEFISTMAVAYCPEKKYIPHLGTYYLCAKTDWGTDCGVAYDFDIFAPHQHGVQHGLLWSKKPCYAIEAASAPSIAICQVTKSPKGHRKCIFHQSHK